MSFGRGRFGSVILGLRVALERFQLRLSTPRILDDTTLRSFSNEQLRKTMNSDAARSAWQADRDQLFGIFPDREIAGGVNVGDRRALYTLVMELAPKHVLEVGTHVGASTLVIAAAMARLTKKGQSYRTTTVDIVDVNAPNGPWCRLGLRHAPIDAVAHLGMQEQVRFVESDSLAFLAQTQEHYDLVFLDGCHRADRVYAEIAMALQRVAQGGVIILHDYFPDGKELFEHETPVCGPFLAMERVRMECPGLKVLPMGDLPWPTKRRGSRSSLALIARS